jgi:hypothetical protein
MVVLVCGGRDFSDYDSVLVTLDEVRGWCDDGQFLIVNGGAHGADELSTRWAKEHSEKFIEVPVAKTPEEAAAIGAKYNWFTYGKAAGPLRNQYMLDTHKPDQGVVFPGGNGTSDMLERLFRRGVNCWVVGR